MLCLELGESGFGVEWVRLSEIGVGALCKEFMGEIKELCERIRLIELCVFLKSRFGCFI